MKNKIFFALLLLLVAILSVIGFKTWKKTDCCKEYPYEMHISAMGLMQACKDLVKNNGVTICDFHLPAVAHVTTSAMSASGFAGPHHTQSGVVSFTHFYYEDSTIFRTAWQKGNVEGKDGCVPKPNIHPFEPPSENHNYELSLIPVSDYQAAPTNFPTTGHIQGVIKTQYITAIENIRLEPVTGYISTKEPTWYSNVYSSKGFVCDVSVSISGKVVKTPCYIINNNDGVAAALKWKVKKECQ